MKKKYLLLAISLGVAVGLYVGVNTDFKKSNILKMVSEIEQCIKKGFSAEEETLDCEGAICLPSNQKNR